MATSAQYADWLRNNQDKRGSPDYQTVLRAFQEAALEENAAPSPQAGPAPEGGFVAAAKAGATELGGDISALMGKVGLKDTAQAEKEYRESREKAAKIFKPTEEGWTEAPWQKFKETLGGSAAYMAAPLAAGVAAGLAPVTGAAATALGLGAAGLTSAGQFTATNLARQIEEGKSLEEASLGSAVAAAAPQALLDTLSMRLIPGIGRLLGSTGTKVTAANAKAIAEQTLRKAAADYAASTGKAIGTEGLTEVAQQVLERAQAGLAIDDPAARKEYVDSFIGGAVLGGALAPAGRFVERAGEKGEARTLLEGEAAKARMAARAEEEKRKASPDYLLDVEQRYQAAVEQMKALQADIKQKPAKDAAPDEKLAYQQKVNALKQFVTDTVRPLTAEYTPLKARISALKAEREKEALSPLDYFMKQMGVEAPAEPTAPAAQPEGVFTGEEPWMQPAQPTPEVAPEQAYLQERMQAMQANDRGTFGLTDYVDYLMQDPKQAQALVTSRAEIPGLSSKENQVVLGGMKLRLEETKAQQRAVEKEQRTQEQADLLAQQRAVPVEGAKSWISALEESEEQAQEELLRPDIGAIKPTQATVETAPGIKPVQRPDVLLRRLDELFTARDKADAEAQSAFASGNKELGIQRSKDREAAQAALNNIGQIEGAPRALMELRKAQDTALMDASQLIDDLKVGRTLSGPEAATASSTPQTLINQINKQRDAFITSAVQEAAATRKLYGKGLAQEEAAKAAEEMRTVFDEWVTRSMAQPRGAVLEERVVQPAQMRGTEVVKGAETELVDPRPLEERRFGAYRAATAVLQEQLQGIAAKLKQVPRAPQRVEPTLKMQFPETEAAKVAEGKGETAKTLEGQLRRRRDYAQGQIDQAFQTRKVPGIAESLLTRAQDFLATAPNTMLDAVENITSRVLNGQKLERNDLVELRDQIRAAAMRPGEAEVAGERVGQRELFPAEERRALAPKEERGALGLIREKPEAFQAVRGKEAAREAKAVAAVQRGEQLTADIRKELDRIDAERVAVLEQRVAERSDALQSAWQSAVKKARNLIISARAKENRQKIKALRAELQPIYDAGVERLTGDNAYKVMSLLEQIDTLEKNLDTVVEAVEFLPKAMASKWVDFEKTGLEEAKRALAEAKTAQNSAAVARQETAVATAERAQKAAEARNIAQQEQLMREKVQTGFGAAGVRVERQGLTSAIRELEARIPTIQDKKKREAATQRLAEMKAQMAETVKPIAPAKTIEQKQTEAAAQRKEAAASAAARQEAVEADRSALEQRVLELGTRVAEREAAQNRARTPESKAKIQTEIDALNKEQTLATAQMEAFEEAKPRRKGPATVTTSSGIGKTRPLRTGYRKVLEAASEGLRREREEGTNLIGELDFGPRDVFFSEVRDNDIYEDRDLTEVSAALKDNVNDGNVDDALNRLASEGTTPFVRELAAKLAKLNLRTKLKVVEGLVDRTGVPVEGYYNPETNTVYLDANAVYEETLTHEFTHAVTLQALNADPSTLTPEQRQARAELEALFKDIQNEGAFKREYAKKTLAEFVSELMSNKQVRDKLDKRNFLQRIYDALLRFIGMDPKTLRSQRAVDNAYALFMPSRPMKAATVASVIRGVFPGHTATYPADMPADVRASLGRTVGSNPTFVDKVMANLTGLAFRTQFIDSWAPVETLLRKGVDKALIEPMQAFQTMYFMRFGQQRNQYLQQAASVGVPQLNKNEEGDFVIESEEGANLASIADKLRNANAGDEQAVEQLFTQYLAILRAEQDGVGYDKLNFDKPMTAAEAKAVKDYINADADRKAAFEDARQEYREYNGKLLDFLVQTGAMTKSEAARLKGKEYVPYYREDADGAIKLVIGNEKPIRIGNIVDQPYLKELVGDKQKILPFFTSAMQNTSMLLDMGLRNIQVKSVAHTLRQMGAAQVRDGNGPSNKHVVNFMEHGEVKHMLLDGDAFGVPADLVVKGMSGIKTTIPWAVKLMAIPANLLRTTVTRFPLYALRQAIRDPLNAWLTTGANFAPIVSSMKELTKMQAGRSPTEKLMQKAGAISSNVFTGGVEDSERILREIVGGGKGWGKAMAKLDAFAQQGDSATRAVLYDRFRREGMTHMQALLGSLESMNFGRRGVSPSMHLMSMMVPFFNAQIQGLDAIYRSAAGKTVFEKEMNVQRKLLQRGAMMAAMTVAYAMFMQDDEAYKNATPEERAQNWFVYLPGLEEPVRVPIPFELGLAFKAIPEMLYNMAAGDQRAAPALKALGKMAMNTVPIGMPQAIKPVVELATNHSFFTGRDIESQREKGMMPEQRFRESTSELAKELGKMLGVSPVQIEHLVRGYFSTMGIMTMQLASIPFKPFSAADAPPAAEKSVSQQPFIGALFQPKDGRGIVDEAFQIAQDAQQASQTYKDMLAKGDRAGARAFAERYSTQLAMASFGGSFRQQMGEFAAWRRAVAASSSMTPTEKKAALDRIKQYEIRYAEMLRASSERAAS